MSRATDALAHLQPTRSGISAALTASRCSTPDLQSHICDLQLH
ncbi:MAG: hypothetical protein SNJ69_14455 [Chloroflexaceae bacterium]